LPTCPTPQYYTHPLHDALPISVFVATPNIYNVFSISDNSPNRPFTLASSVGTVDEDSTAIVQLRNFTVTLLPAATGSVHIRYNIDRKSTRLNSSHEWISYAVCC